jgi:maltose alpha-D-glucosyltransferase/alpha-amylase
MAHPGLTHSDPLWYKDAIIYELHVRAFYNSNGDGVGDFPGLAQKLDYLQGLGDHDPLVAAVLSLAPAR